MHIRALDSYHESKCEKEEDPSEFYLESDTERLILGGFKNHASMIEMPSKNKEILSKLREKNIESKNPNQDRFRYFLTVLRSTFMILDTAS
jgi:hypothetical protein